MNITKESEEYPSFIGKCPICNKQCEVIKTVGELRKAHIKYKTIHENEWGKHVVSEDGVDYYYKYKEPKLAYRGF